MKTSGAIGALVADALDQLVGIALDQPDTDAAFLRESLIQGTVAVIVAGGIDIHLLRLRRTGGEKQGEAGGNAAEAATRRACGHGLTPNCRGQC
jgi:hypothetical protein